MEFSNRTQKETHMACLHQASADIILIDSSKTTIHRGVEGKFSCPDPECLQENPNPRLIRKHYLQVHASVNAHSDKKALSKAIFPRSASPIDVDKEATPPPIQTNPSPLRSPALLRQSSPSRSPSPDPMDIDLSPHALHIPDNLRPLGLGFNSHHGVLICTFCHIGLRRAHIIGHFKSFHKEIRLPSNLLTLLDKHHIKEDSDIVQPTGLIAPIEGIEQVQGMRCKVANCYFACRTKGSMEVHLAQQHKGIGRFRDFVENCFVQSFSQVHRHYFPVLGDLAAFDPNDEEIDVAAYNTWLLTKDTFIDPLAHAPTNPRYVHQFHRRHNWYAQVDKLPIKTLVQSVAMPHVNEIDLKNLNYIVKRFFSFISKEILLGLDLTIKRWLKSEKGYVIF